MYAMMGCDSALHHHLVYIPLTQAMIKGDKQAVASSVLEVGGTQLAVPDF